MSWFDPGVLANIAKTALKEAQKTIDKALDIKEDVENSSAPTNTPIDTNSDDFFGTWGISDAGENKTVLDVPIKSNKMSSNSIWGSFTGSYFIDDTILKGSPKSPSSVEILDDSLDSSNNQKGFSKSKLVVQQSEEDIISNEDQVQVQKEFLDSLVEGKIDDQLQNSLKKQSNNNRSSIVSSGSSKNNSESIDILTGGTECTTTPESELFSNALSASTSESVQEGTSWDCKPTSESIEILCDSLTSPSSVEIIDSDSTNTNSRRHSPHTDEFISPIETPCGESAKLISSQEKNSPESIEIIPEDENSVAEDTMSYTSISESTSATVLDTVFHVHKSQKMLKDTYNRPEFSETISSDTGSLSPDRSFNVGEAITRAPGRTKYLPLQQVHSSQILIDNQPYSMNNKPTILENTTNIIDIPQDDENVRSSGSSETPLDTSTEDGSISDKTLVENQENSAMETSSDTNSTTTEASSNSTYLKKMLADAMIEKSPEPEIFSELRADFSDKASSIEIIHCSSANNECSNIPRENSPLSSEKSDLVKVGSDHTSCHTSCDELETTTSSDIEIISSPTNGDSSSTQSRQSPTKKLLHQHQNVRTNETNVDNLLTKMTIRKAKGHSRELSEASSSISDDSHTNGADIDRLLKRISEMTEILELRESKLIDTNRRNVELLEQNSDLKSQMDYILNQQLESVNVTQITDEYTQRISVLEKKFQQVIRENDDLKKQLELIKRETATSMTKSEFESLLSEKDETIKELREEGEKLSKQQLQHSNIIKKLRAKEKEHETTIKNLKECNESLTIETERLKKSLNAKEDVERSQIEAVHNLTSKNKKLDSELSKLRSQMDDLTQKYDTTKKSLEAAKKELVEKNRVSSDLLAREQMFQRLENEKKMTESQNEDVINQLDNLRMQIGRNEDEYVKKVQKMKQENAELLRKLQEAENKNEELSQSVLEISKPLIRQLESLQATHSVKMANFEKIEQELILKMGDLQSKLQNSVSLERAVREECVNLRSKLADLEGQLNSAKHEIEMHKMQLELLKTERQITEQELKSKVDKVKDECRSKNKIVEDIEKEMRSLRQQISLEKLNYEAERKRYSVQEESKPALAEEGVSTKSGSNSPTLSLGKVSVSESLNSSFWSQEEPFEVTHTPRYTNMFEMQMLQTNLKQKEGELQQLQWELNRRENERSLLNGEISLLINKMEKLEAYTKEMENLKAELCSLQQQYDTLCQLYGEKVEENEEIKLDLVDVKEMYKIQIDELLRQQKEK